MREGERSDAAGRLVFAAHRVILERLKARLSRPGGIARTDAAAAGAAAPVDPRVRLRHLQELHTEGFVTDAEFELARVDAADTSTGMPAEPRRPVERRVGERRLPGERRRWQEGWLAWAAHERRSGEDRRRGDRRAAPATMARA